LIEGPTSSTTRAFQAFRIKFGYKTESENYFPFYYGILMNRIKKDDLTIAAFLENGDQRIPITAKCASRYSLWIKFRQGCEYTSNDIFTLIVPTNDECLEIGPCRLISDPDQNGHNGRLVFLKDVYDIHSLLSKNKVVKLQSAFHDLPILLARKKNINQSFIDFTANLTYDLSIYKNLFDLLDSQYREEPEAIKTAIQTALIKSEGQKFKCFLDDKLAELERMVMHFSTEEHQYHGFYFRKQLWNFLLCSPLMARCILKPRGYSGDSEIIKMIYQNDYLGDSTFSNLLQKHGVEHTAAQSVRNRILLIVQLLCDFQEKAPTHSTDKLKILSVGSGPAFEMRDILKSSHDCSKFHFSLLDQDPKALSEADSLIQNIEKKLKAKVDFDLIKGSVRTMLFSKSLKHKLDQFNFIYSMGLFDYLSAPVAKALLTKLYQMLKPGGEMVIGNFHASNPSRYYMEYWCDWVLTLRTEEEFIELSADIPPTANHSIIFEDTGSQMFLHLKKQVGE
jgi:extracellular factor (EF) 3-hydroxypalmitic acid methyl ester biosynthesis protein